jgi:hypothetical protein
MLFTQSFFEFNVLISSKLGVSDFEIVGLVHFVNFVPPEALSMGAHLPRLRLPGAALNPG